MGTPILSKNPFLWNVSTNIILYKTEFYRKPEHGFIQIMFVQIFYAKSRLFYCGKQKQLVLVPWYYQRAHVSSILFAKRIGIWDTLVTSTAHTWILYFISVFLLPNIAIFIKESHENAFPCASCPGETSHRWHCWGPAVPSVVVPSLISYKYL